MSQSLAVEQLNFLMKKTDDEVSVRRKRFTGADVAESRVSSSRPPVVEGFTKNLGNLRYHRDGFHAAIVESGVHIGRRHPI